MSPSPAPERVPDSRPGDLLLEYVTLPFCRDCLRFEAQVGEMAGDYPELRLRAVPAESERGRRLSVDRGVMRFPVIVLDGEVIATESISDGDLRRHLDRAAGA